MTDYLKKRWCHDCDAVSGELHQSGCDCEVCPLCGGQMISCPCIYEVNGMNYNTLAEEHPDIYKNGATDEMEAVYIAEINKYGGLLPWTGLFPGIEACIEFGWYFVEDMKAPPGSKTVRCSADHPLAYPDLNRLNPRHAVWDKKARKWKLP